MDRITAYPLAYPSWQPRTPTYRRRAAQFGSKNGDRFGIKQLTLSQAIGRVYDQLRAFTKPGRPFRVDMDDIVISTNLATRMDGLPKSGQAKPGDPGAAVYFVLDGERQCVPCDTYTRVEDNIAGIAHTLECFRAIERHGSGMLKAAMTGFRALPGPDHFLGRNWRDVLEYDGDDFHEAKRQYQRRSSETHPDRGGDNDKFHEVQKAWERAQEELQQ